MLGHVQIMRQKLNPWLMDYTDDKGNKVDDEAVEGGDEADLEAAAEDTHADIADGVYGVQGLEETKEGPEDTNHKGADTNFLNPLGGFPGGDEKGHEEQGDYNHSGHAAFDKQSGEGNSGFLDGLRVRYAQGVHNIDDFFFHDDNDFGLLQSYAYLYQISKVESPSGPVKTHCKANSYLHAAGKMPIFVVK